MQESNVQTVGAVAGSLVYKANTHFVTHCQSLADAILDLEGYVVNTATSVVKEFLNSAFGAGGLL